jgi:predicted outer membrane repeat protein
MGFRGGKTRRSVVWIVAGSIWLGCGLAVTASAAALTVTSTADSGPGTLRAAIAGAGNNDVIEFSLNYPATITLTTGELAITNNLSIVGPGAANLTITGNNSSRVFQVGTGNTVTISGLTISGGIASAGGVGAGIYCDQATLMLVGCVFQNNNATGGSTANGAGIYGNQSQLNINGCTFTGNSATGNGGGIYSTGSTLTVGNSTITGNSGLSGGGIYDAGGTIALTNCFISANGATHGGGVSAVGVLGLAAVTINNCTLSSNAVSGASATGSQIYVGRQLSNASATIGNSTLLSDNVAPAYSGGAIYSDNGGTVTVGNTIIQAGVQEHTLLNAGSGTIASAGYNLSTDNGSGFLTGPNDQTNIDPLLDLNTGPRDNGGSTYTIALQANSPAIDKGKRDAIPSLAATTDQRGEMRPFDDPNVVNASGGDGSDIGAYEASLRLVSAAKAGSDLQVTFTSIVGKSYQLQERSSLVSGTWNSFGDTVAGNGGVAPLNAAGAFNQSIHFYQVLQSPQTMVLTKALKRPGIKQSGSSIGLSTRQIER